MHYLLTMSLLQSNQDKLDQLAKIATRCAQDSSLIIDSDYPQLVFGKGNVNAQIVIIGEAPGKNEAEQGFPFVGAAGKQLDKLLNTIGLTIEDVYIANILKFRPTKNRDPKPDEIALHTPYLIKQIDIIKPKILLTLGNFATKFVLGGFTVSGMKSIQGISQLHGQVLSVTRDSRTYTVLPSYHPAAMMYKGSLRAIIELDFEKMKEYLNG